jgi:hypothetical protein
MAHLNARNGGEELPISGRAGIKPVDLADDACRIGYAGMLLFKEQSILESGHDSIVR